MEQAVKKVYGFSQEYKDRYWEDMYEKAEYDYISDMEGAKEEGRADRNLEIARNMISKGLSTEMIKELTGLNEKEISDLKV